MKGLIIPAYIYPNREPSGNFDSWRLIIEAARILKDRLIVVLNADNGPGESISEDYKLICEEVNGHGSSILGYVHTCWGLGKDCSGWKCKNDWIEHRINRLRPVIEEDIDTWFDFYSPYLDGIFLDEVSIDSEKVDFYKKIADKVKSFDHSAIVVNNYGMMPAPDYFTIPGIIHCTLEQKYKPSPKTHWGGYLNWQSLHDSKANASAVLLHATNIDDWRSAFNKAVQDKFDWLYITDAIGDNPWGQLPSYFEDLAQAVLEKSKYSGLSWFKKIFPF